MYNDIIKFLDQLNNPPKDIRQLIENNNYILERKGYGTPELEMKFLHNIFLYIQKSCFDFESFSWQQCNAYNDEYYHFQLSSFIVSNKLNVDSDISFYFKYNEGENMSSNISFFTIDDSNLDEPIDNTDFDMIDILAKERNLKSGRGLGSLNEVHLNAYLDYKQKKYQRLKIACLKMLAILKLLEANFSMYYFLYTLGNGVEVKFNKAGVTITKLDKNEIQIEGAAPLGKGMDL